MSIAKAREYFKQFGMEERILEFEISSETVSLAAIAVGCEPKRIAKTLSFMVDDKPILIVTAGDAKIANAQYKEKFHAKAKMLSYDEVETLIGHAVGGVCPFGVNEDVKIYLDNSLKQLEVVYPASGTANSAVKLKVTELESIVKNEKWIDVCKELNNE